MNNKNCYASIIGECAGGISKEHYVSKAVLELISKAALTLYGAPWQERGQETNLTIQTFTAKVLCEKHNNQLSVLDMAAQDFLKTIFVCTRGGIQGQIDVSNLTFNYNGRDIERWLLKIACGAIASGNWGGKHRIVPNEWVEVLFLQKEWPDNFVLYSSEKTEYEVTEKNHIRCDFRRNSFDNILQGITFVFMCLDITLVLGNYNGVPGLRRPTDFAFKYNNQELVLKLIWKNNRISQTQYIIRN